MNRWVNRLIATIGLALRRTWTALGSHAAVALGVLVAATTICALILYAEAVNVAVLRDRLARAHEDAVYDLLIKGEANLIDRARYQEMDGAIARQVQEVVGLPVTRSGRHGWSKSLLIVPPGPSPAGRRSELPRTRFQFYAGVEDQIEVVEGHFPRPATDPQDTIEVMITEPLAEELGLRVDDVFHVEDFTGGALPMQVQVQLASIIRLRDPGSNFWFYAPWFLDEAFTVPEETFFNAVVLAFVPAGAEFTWVANYDENAVNVTNARQVLAGLDVLRFSLTSQLGQLQFLTEFDNAIRDFLTGIFVLRALLIVLGAPVIGIALYYIVITSQLIVERQRAEIAVLKSRGSSNGQVFGGLDRPDSGTVLLGGRDIARLSEAELIALRRYQVGFVFQSFGLLPQFSAYESVELALRLAGVPRAQRRPRAVECLTMVGLEHRLDHRPYELSGGQQQRLCIARAIANRPALILADEPTGELDSQTGREILSLFRQIVALGTTALIVATHDPVIYDFATAVHELEDGRFPPPPLLLPVPPTLGATAAPSADPATRGLAGCRS